jgi:hypothetical protein
MRELKSKYLTFNTCPDEVTIGVAVAVAEHHTVMEVVVSGDTVTFEEMCCQDLRTRMTRQEAIDMLQEVIEIIKENDQ